MLFKSSIVCRGFILVLFCSSACVCWFVSLLIVFYLFTCVYLSFVCLCHSVSTSLCHRVIGTFPETIYMYFFFYYTGTVLPVKNDSDVMFCLQSYRGLKLLDQLCINPIHRI